MLSKSSYSKVPTWKEKFADNKVSLSLLDKDFHKSWKELFEKLSNDKRFQNRVERELSEELKDDEKLIMHPPPDYVFNAFKLTTFKKLKVVIIGQDPYFDHETHENRNVSQAMGLSFSVPFGIKVPSSLRNIYANLKKYGHIQNIPEHGNLESWAEQGCLLLNTSLTVKDGTINKNCHQFIWGWFTDEIISYISDNKEHVIFVLWGSHALGKKDLIDTNKHEVIVSSHPSGLSVGKPMKEYPAFNANDHFGKINEKLKEWDRNEIDWNL
jgi:uracil-DNA glycosylase